MSRKREVHRPGYPLDRAGALVSQVRTRFTPFGIALGGAQCDELSEADLGKGRMLRFKVKRADKGSMVSAVHENASNEDSST